MKKATLQSFIQEAAVLKSFIDDRYSFSSKKKRKKKEAN